MTAAEYAGRDFDLALGEVYGLRVWRMDSYGRLLPRYVEDAGPWRPGINVAGCHKPDQSQFFGRFLNAVSGGGFVVTGPGGEPVSSPEPERHEAPSEACQCGFYAYTGPGIETYADSEGTVLGVIRGTGRTLIGTKGFRCEKAEILALLDPTGAAEPAAWAEWQRDLLRRAYRDVPLLPSRAGLLQFAPITDTAPDPADDEFWSLP